MAAAGEGEVEQATLRIGDTVGNFVADSTAGELDFYKYVGKRWSVVFSHPGDFTPVCATEIGEVSRLAPEFSRRDCVPLSISIDNVATHNRWLHDIESCHDVAVNFPIVDGSDGQLPRQFGMFGGMNEREIGPDGRVMTIRATYIVDPEKVVRASMFYPVFMARFWDEILRTIDGLQTMDRAPVALPVNWLPGDDVLLLPSVTEAEAEHLFPDHKKIALPSTMGTAHIGGFPYIRVAKDPRTRPSAPGEAPRLLIAPDDAPPNHDGLQMGSDQQGRPGRAPTATSAHSGQGSPEVNSRTPAAAGPAVFELTPAAKVAAARVNEAKATAVEEIYSGPDAADSPVAGPSSNSAPHEGDAVQPLAASAPLSNGTAVASAPAAALEEFE